MKNALEKVKFYSGLMGFPNFTAIKRNCSFLTETRKEAETHNGLNSKNDIELYVYSV